MICGASGTRKVSAITIATAVVVGGLIAQPAAAHAAPVDTSGLSELAAGSVVDTDGGAPSEAWVTVTLWPEQIAPTADGSPDDVAAQLLGSAKVAKDGTFAVGTDLLSFVPNSPTIAAEFESLMRGEPVNVLIDAFTLESTNLYATSIRYDAETDSFVSVVPPPSTDESPLTRGSKVEPSGVTVSAASVDGTLDLAIPLQPATDKGYRLSDSQLARSADAPHIPCFTATGNYPQVWTNVGRISAQTPNGYSAVFSNSTGTTTHLGVGVSASGSFGSFTSSGSTTQTSGVTTTWPALTSGTGATYSTQFSYGRYEGRGCFSGPIVPPKRYFVEAYQHWGGQKTESLLTFADNYCASYSAGGSVTVDSGWGENYMNSAKIGSQIGTDLSASQAYTQSAKFTVSLTQNRQVCGEKGPLGSQSVGTISIK
jgi:hypothetical protein